MMERNREETALSGMVATGVLKGLVDALFANAEGFIGRNGKQTCHQSLPSRDVVDEIITALRSVLFPGYFGFSDVKKEHLPFHIGSTLDHVRLILREQIKRGLSFACRDDIQGCLICDEQAEAVTEVFLGRLPGVQAMLAADVHAAFEGDPAASSLDEVIFCYPGLWAITNYRLAHELYQLGVPFIPRMITEHAHSSTGIDIHPGATIGRHFFIDHGTGVVIGETCIIGDRVRIYQGVTLGAKSFKLDEEGHPVKGLPRHPIVEDDVTIYSGATILGRVAIGHDSVIGGNVWLVGSVPPHSRIAQMPPHYEDFEMGAGI